MYKPFPFDDPVPVNRVALGEETVRSLVAGTEKCAAAMAGKLAEAAAERTQILALDGYTTADWSRFVTLLKGRLEALGIGTRTEDFSRVYRSERQIYNLVDKHLSWDREADPTLLFGKIYHGGYEGLIDAYKLQKLTNVLEMEKDGRGRVVIVYGCGCLVGAMRWLYDVKCWFDVTPKESILRIRRGAYKNLGMKEPLPVSLMIRRCYYADFEVAVGLRKEILQGTHFDYYFDSDHEDDLKMLPQKALSEIFASAARQPFRCKPVYLEGVWGGTYMKKLRHLPEEMRNCAWVFDMIPMEVSVMVDVGGTVVEFPFCSLFMKEGDAVMGRQCVKKYGGYFPIRFNYDDSYHSTGNMSIQCHSGGKYNIEHYNELGRQDESYYVVVTGHDAKTFIGFRDDADLPQFFRDIEAADKEHKSVDYMKYISYEESRPGLQVMLPAGTVHSSGRNQVILEIGSLTVGSYTYKMYDYLRLDFDGKQRPIHTKLGKENVAQDRRTSWIRENVVQKPRFIRGAEGQGECILGEHELMYISLRRLEFEKSIEDDTKGRFHVLTVVDGEKVRIRSKAHPERFYDASFMDVVVVPASLGQYEIINLGAEPIRIHKTLLKDGFEKCEP